MERLNNDGGDVGLARRFESVLIVEDDGLLSIMMEDLVREHGASNVRVCRSLDSAMDAARDAFIDCAILDVSLHTGSTYEIADTLGNRDIPFLFCTGISPNDLAERHRHRPLLRKPYSDEQFTACLELALAG